MKITFTSKQAQVGKELLFFLGENCIETFFIFA
jgi:hypothetical protein